MARPENLIPGNCYFSVGYYDNDLLLPMIQTLIYVEPNEDEDGRRVWLFEEPPRPPDPDDRQAAAPERVVEMFPDEQLHGILDFPGLLQWIAAVAVDHPLHPVPSRDAGPATDAQFASLSTEVRKFLDSPEYVSVTITVRFTDEGFSLGRGERGYTADFFPHPTFNPGKDVKILSLFSSLGVRPNVDYLADRGRTRVLEFSMPQEYDGIVQVCRRVLTEVYAMRQDDALDYHWLAASDLRKADPTS